MLPVKIRKRAPNKKKRKKTLTIKIWHTLARNDDNPFAPSEGLFVVTIINHTHTYFDKHKPKINPG